MFFAKLPILISDVLEVTIAKTPGCCIACHRPPLADDMGCFGMSGTPFVGGSASGRGLLAGSTEADASGPECRAKTAPRVANTGSGFGFMGRLGPSCGAGCRRGFSAGGDDSCAQGNARPRFPEAAADIVPREIETRPSATILCRTIEAGPKPYANIRRAPANRRSRLQE